MSRPDVAVIGIGSPFGGDRLGLELVHHLQMDGGRVEGVDYLVEDRPGLSLIELMQGYRQVILVDAILSDDGEAGSVRHLDQQQLTELSQNGISSHVAGVAEAVALGAALDDLPRQLDLVGVEIRGYEEDMFPDLLNRVGEEVGALLSVE